MNVDEAIRTAMAKIAADIFSRLDLGNAEIARAVAEHKAWLRHWPLPAPNHRSAGQFLRHMKRRNAAWGEPLSSREET